MFNRTANNVCRNLEDENEQPAEEKLIGCTNLIEELTYALEKQDSISEINILHLYKIKKKFL